MVHTWMCECVRPCSAFAFSSSAVSGRATALLACKGSAAWCMTLHGCRLFPACRLRRSPAKGRFCISRIRSRLLGRYGLTAPLHNASPWLPMHARYVGGCGSYRAIHRVWGNCGHVIVHANACLRHRTHGIYIAENIRVSIEAFAPRTES